MAEMEDDDVAAVGAAGEDGSPEAASLSAGAAQPYVFEPPYPPEMLTKMNLFFKGRKKAPYDFEFSPAGDLHALEGARIGKRGKPWPETTLGLKSFVPLEAEERQALEERRQEEIGRIQEEYEEVSTELQMAWEAYRQTGEMRGVLLANQKMREVDAQLSAVLYAARDIVSIRDLPTKQVLFDEPYEERKLIGGGGGGPGMTDPFSRRLYRISKYTFPQFVELGKYVEPVTEVEAADAEETASAGPSPSELDYRKRLADGRIARIFFESGDDKNGFLSPMYPVAFTFKGAEYFTAYQAYEVARAEELQLPKQAADLLGTRSTRTMRLITRNTPNHPADARGLWLGILTAVYQQHPPLQAQLLETGTDALVYADMRAGPSGIGLAEKDRGVLDAAKWKGENAVGLALETIRTRLREKTLEEAPREEEVEKKVISEKEQEKAKVAAIITAKRRKA
jgi:predicted NAD-dependent protein-ADP-ribosyltransferase YbiA (DUF1768 family)